MDPGWIAAIAVIVVNIFGWGFTFGNLNGRVKSLEDTTKRHEKTLNEDGLMQEVSNLAGKVQTYIDLTKGR